MTLGIGFLGCGPAAQAIHLPALQAFADRVRPVAFMDIDEALAQRLAGLHDGVATTDEDVLIEHPAVDVVVVGSPNAHHARQVVKACRAGKRAVLVEKPLAVSRSEVAEIAAAARAAGTQLLVGSMHAYDEAYGSSLRAWRALGEEATDIEVTAFLPGNDVMVDAATQLVRSATPVGGPPSGLADVQAVTSGILGLASHDIPLVRDFVPQVPDLMAATRLRPAGYSLQGVAGACAVAFTGLLPVQWEPQWRLRVVSPQAILEVAFQQSYVLATSCVASLTVDGCTRTWHSVEAAYVAEWRALLGQLNGADPARPLDSCTADLEYALDLIAQLPTAMDAGAV